MITDYIGGGLAKWLQYYIGVAWPNDYNITMGRGGWSSQFLPLNLQQQQQQQQQKQWYEMLHLYKDFSIVWIEYVFLWQMHFVAIYM